MNGKQTTPVLIRNLKEHLQETFPLISAKNQNLLKMMP